MAGAGLVGSIYAAVSGFPLLVSLTATLRLRHRSTTVYGCPARGRWQRRHNSTHAKIRCLGEQAMATLNDWRLLRKLRCSTNRITAIVQAVLILQHASA